MGQGNYSNSQAYRNEMAKKEKAAKAAEEAKASAQLSIQAEPEKSQFETLQDQFKTGLTLNDDQLSKILGYSPEEQFKKSQQSYKDLENRKNQGLMAPEYQGISDNMKVQDKALRMALSKSGANKGGMAANLKGQQNMAANMAIRNADIQSKVSNRDKYDQVTREKTSAVIGSQYQTSGLLMNINAELDKARLLGSASSAALAANNSEGSGGLLSSIFDALF